MIKAKSISIQSNIDRLYVFAIRSFIWQINTKCHMVIPWMLYVAGQTPSLILWANNYYYDFTFYLCNNFVFVTSILSAVWVWGNAMVDIHLRITNMNKTFKMWDINSYRSLVCVPSNCFHLLHIWYGFYLLQSVLAVSISVCSGITSLSQAFNPGDCLWYEANDDKNAGLRSWKPLYLLYFISCSIDTYVLT